MKNLYCIECPVGCELRVIGTGSHTSIEGNKCAKGEEFAISETSNPMRILTTTVRTNFPDIPVISVRTAEEIPKTLLMSAMQVLSEVTVEKELGCGDVVVDNLLGSGVSVIVTSGALQQVGAELENRNVQLSGEITPNPTKQVVTAMPSVTMGDEKLLGNDSQSGSEDGSEEGAEEEVAAAEEKAAEEESIYRRGRAQIRR